VQAAAARVAAVNSVGLRMVFMEKKIPPPEEKDNLSRRYLTFFKNKTTLPSR